MADADEPIEIAGYPISADQAFAAVFRLTEELAGVDWPQVQISERPEQGGASTSVLECPRCHGQHETLVLWSSLAIHTTYTWAPSPVVGFGSHLLVSQGEPTEQEGDRDDVLWLCPTSGLPVQIPDVASAVDADELARHVDQTQA